MQGNFVEVGIAPCGSFGTTNTSPAGYHSRVSASVGSQALGFVADIGKDGWATGSPNFVGDYFLPGTPEEGWGLTINGTSYNNNLRCGSGTNQIVGSIINYSNTASEVSATWQGSQSGLSITARTYIPKNSLYFITEVSITNTSAATINNVYYMRNVDPDQGVYTPGGGGVFTTNNSIVSQNPNSCNQALVSATTAAGAYYLGLGSIDSRARVTHGGFSNRSALNIYNGTGLNSLGTLNGVDQAISIAFNLGNLAPNQVATFAYAYILSPSDLNVALAATNTTFNINGTTYTSGSTASVCNGGNTPIILQNIGTYTSWTWLPTAGLTPSTGTNVVANVTSPTTYTATGTGTCGSVNITIALNPTTGLPVACAGPITGPTSISLGQTARTYSTPAVTNATKYTWVLPPGSVVTSGLNSNTITFNASNISWCGNITVTPSNDCNSGCSSSLAVCLGNILNTGSVPTSLCAGASTSVSYTASGIFNAGNIFTAQLSDANGSFVSPLAIGTLTSTALSGNIGVTIPMNTISGSGYRIRIVSSNLSGVGADNGTDIVINSAPVITCPANISVNSDNNSCGATVNYSATATGIGTTITFSPASGSTFSVGTTPVTATATNSCGSQSCTFNVIVSDSIVPTISCAGSVTVYTDLGVCGATVALTAPTTSDNCGVASVSNNAPTLFPVGTTTVTWTVTDVNNNTNTCTQTVTVTDNEVPSITCGANVTQNNDAGNCSAVVTVVSPTGSDNCGVASIINSYTGTNNASGTYPAGVTVVNWTITDIHGNMNFCTQTITVLDAELPSITCSGDVSVNNDPTNCSAFVGVTSPTVSDNCGVASISNNAPSNFPVGTTTVTWTVTDIHGNTNTCTQNVTVTDNEVPSISCGGPVSVNNDLGQCGAAVSLTDPTTSDNCGVASVSNNAPTLFPVGTTTVTWTVTDIHNNTNTCTQAVTVTDNEAPSINCGAAVSVNNDLGVCGATVSLTAPTTNDNCGVASVTNNAPTLFPIGSTTVTWTVTDVNNNTNTCTQTVTVTDNEVPSITCDGPITVNNDLGVCGATLTLNTPTTSDNCGVASVTNNAPASYPVGTTTVTWTVTDINNNVNTCTQTVTVIDNTAPVVSCNGNITVNNDFNQCGAVVTYPFPTVTDNCTTCNAPTSLVGYTFLGAYNGHTYFMSNSATLWPNANAAAIATGGHLVSIADAAENSFVNSVAYTSFFTGGFQNFSSPSYTEPAGGWEWSDGTPFTYTAWNPGEPNNYYGDERFLQYYNGASTWNDIFPWTSLPYMVEFDCGISAHLSAGLASGSFFPIGTTTVTYTATDSSGNVGSCSFTVTVNDNQGPQIYQPDVYVDADATSCTAVANYAATVTDCTPGTNTVSYSVASGSAFAIGYNPVTVTATDVLSNTSTFTFNVIVSDVTAPVIACPSNMVVNNDPGQCGAVVNYSATATDCQTLSISYVPASGSVFHLGTTPVTVTAVDASSNTSTCTFTVTVNDNEAPVISGCPANISVNNDANTCGAIVNFTLPTASENCSFQSQTFSYTGSTQTFTVPAGVTSLDFDVQGAWGGQQYYYYYYTTTGSPGMGGKVTGTIPVTPGQVLAIEVGGAGQSGNSGSVGIGGYNGGDDGGSYYG